VSRRDFDGALINAARDAGAEIVEERVVDVEAAPESVTVQTRAHRFRARFLVGADGASSLVRRRLHHPFPATHWSLATGFFARGATSQEMVVRFVRDPPGYIWSFPRANHLAIGICAPADSTDPKALRSHLDRWLARQDLTAGRTLAPYTWPIPTLPFDAWAGGVPVGDRWLLAGDAAGLVDPLTREGIYYALRSGELAAGALLGSAASPSHAYAARLRNEFITELVKSARARRTFFSPLVTRLWIDVLQESPRVRDLALQVVIGTVGYHHIRRRAVGAIEASAAARVAGRQIRRGLGLAP
jgi:flavin-dependent dehydrogenase